MQSVSSASDSQSSFMLAKSLDFSFTDSDQSANKNDSISTENSEDNQNELVSIVDFQNNRNNFTILTSIQHKLSGKKKQKKNNNEKLLIKATAPPEEIIGSPKQIKKISQSFSTSDKINQHSSTLWADDQNESMEIIHEKLIKKIQSEKCHDHSEVTSTYDSDLTSRTGSEDNSQSDFNLFAPKRKKKKFKRLYKVSSSNSMSSGSLVNSVDTNSKTKDKLKNLNKFVDGYSNRKIMSNWDIVESKFKSSPYFQVVMERGADGLSYPIKHKVIHLSSLTLVLCSDEIRLKHKELTKLLEDIGYNKDQILLSRKVAAIKLVLRTAEDPAYRAKYTAYLDKLLSEGGEPLVSINQVKARVFPSDPVEYKRALDTIDKERTQRLMQLVEDRKIKVEMHTKMEKRIEKAVAEFNQEIGILQFPKGLMNQNRFSQFYSIIDFAKSIVHDVVNSVTVGLDPEVVELIGSDMFPKKSMALQQEDPDNPFSNNNDSGVSEDIEENIHKKNSILTGPPRLLPLLVDCVRTGKGLNGFACSDVVELVQAYAATTLQRSMRGFHRRWRYSFAKRMWTQRELKWVTNVFISWSKTVKYYVAIKTRCWRKIKVWRSLLGVHKRRREMFRACFWPFFVWRRYTNDTCKAKEKVEFLVRRVMPMLMKLRVFRGWKWYSKVGAELNRKAINFKQSRLKNALVLQFRWLHKWARRRKRLRRVWYRRGILMYEFNLHRCMRKPFVVWRSYIFYKSCLRGRVKAKASIIRTALLGEDYPPHPPKKKEKKTKKRQKSQRRGLGSAGTPGGSSQSSRDSRAQGYGDIDPIIHFKKFDWTPKKERYDISSDVEETNEVPEKMKSVYDVTVHNLPTAKEIEFLEYETNKLILAKVNKLALKFKTVELWALLGASMVYHRVAHRAFRHLRTYAIVRRNLRNALHKRRMRILRVCVVRMATWMQSTTNSCDLINSKSRLSVLNSNSNSLQPVSQALSDDIFGEHDYDYDFDAAAAAVTELRSHAEILAFQSKRHRLEKSHRLRAAIKQIKEKEETMKLLTDDEGVGRERSGTESELLDDASFSHRVQSREGSQRIMTGGSSYKLSKSKLSTKRTVTSASAHHGGAGAGAGAGGVTGGGLGSVGASRPQSAYDTSQEEDSISISSASTSTGMLSSNSSLYSQRRGLHGSGASRPASGARHSTALTVASTTASSHQEGVGVSRQNSTASSLAGKSPSSAAGTSTGRFSRNASMMSPDSVAPFEIDNVNMLQWDRQDREVELRLGQAMTSCSKQMHRDARTLVFEAEREEKERAAKQEMKRKALEELLRRENQDTATAEDAEIDYVNNFKVKAADVLLDVLVKVNQEIVQALEKTEMKHVFRSIRLCMLEKKSIAMRNRIKMINWIRLCRRLAAVSDLAYEYHDRRKQWIVFCRWLKLVEKERFDATPGLVAAIRRRSALHDAFSDLLRDRGFRPLIYSYASTRMHEGCSDLTAVFRRWLQFTQEELVFKILMEKAAKIYEMKMKQICFVSIRTYMKSVDTLPLRSRDVPYIIIRLQTDIDQMVKRFISHRRRTLSFLIKQLNRRYSNCRIREAKKSPSFKKFHDEFIKDVNIRIMMEQRLLLEAFEQKGQLDFRDIRIPSKMALGEGKPFADPAQKKSYNTSILSPGFKISKFRLVLQEGMGIVGWQTVWSGDNCCDLESPRRGKWIGAGAEVHELEIGSDDFVNEVEYVYEGSVITGVRLKTNMKGWMRWVGGKVSHSAHTVRLSADQVMKDGYEDEIKVGPEERRSPGLPRCYITGFTGLQNVTRATMLGIVVRKIRSHNIFSYYWVNDDTRNSTSNTQDNSTLPYISSNSSLSDDSHHSKPMNFVYAKQSSLATLLSGITESTRLDPEEMISASTDHLTRVDAEFFNVLRMRLTELRAAEGRALSFARRLWSAARFRKPPYSFLSTIRILPALTRWYFESLSKSLVAAPVSEVRAAALKRSARILYIRSEAIRRRVIAIKSEANSIDFVKKAWAVALLGPKERKIQQSKRDRLSSLKEDIRRLSAEADLLDEEAHRMEEMGESLLPVIQLSVRVCQNIKMKIEASRHLSSLLERMDMHTIKAKLAGYKKNNVISIEDMEMIGVNLRSQGSRFESLTTLSDVVEEELSEERIRVAKQKEMEGIREREIKDIILSKSADTKALSVLKGRKKSTFRRNLAVDPVITHVDRKSHLVVSSSQSESAKIVKIPSALFGSMSV